MRRLLVVLLVVLAPLWSWVLATVLAQSELLVPESALVSGVPALAQGLRDCCKVSSLFPDWKCQLSI